ncbi:hypothetical protein SAMN05518849_102250 [Sphingobium sp. AP50]|uniref:LysR family transcriptional regulator n=1 Tax=Sphingobium sp. AP50 TaxID=1884369 RepID=UPI0008D64F25|nr:LysR family transcriptional regulator [Sphingobium sp. AP50]SEJ02783.1 hypothetical protein SAMN05518849_102250 [Sphingobium sp. AP50]
MEQQASPSAPARWTPVRQRLFLTTLFECGSVVQAARTAGMSASSAHRLRRRLAGTPFDHDWSRALELHAHALADPIAGHRRPPAPARR